MTEAGSLNLSSITEAPKTPKAAGLLASLYIYLFMYICRDNGNKMKTTIV